MQETITAEGAIAKVRADRGAHISFDQRYRYTLWREWGKGPRVTWVMLNPSTANANIDDPTIRRVIAFSKQEGFQGCSVVNLFALRSTDPRVLRTHSAPVGPENDAWILTAAKRTQMVICAWGANGGIQTAHIGRRDQKVLKMLRENNVDLFQLGPHRTKEDHPKHPLYMASTTRATAWRR